VYQFIFFIRRSRNMYLTITTAVFILLVNPATVSISLAGPGEIQGTVFRDYDADGTIDGTEPGVAGITVTAYDGAGTAVATTATNANGDYTLGGLTDTQEYRIEFTGLPGYLLSGPTGADSITTAAFVTSPSTNAHLAVNNPGHYCQSNPELATTCFINGDPLLGGTAASGDVFVSYPYSASGQNAGLINHIAVANQMGPVWGIAYQRSTSTLFTAAIMKRHAGFGSLGTGGLYAVDYSNPASPVVSNFLDLNTLAGVNTGADPRTAPGYPPLPASATSSSTDPGAFDAAGKMALGDIDISEDEQTLYIMNLNARTLLALDIASQTLVSQTAVPDPGCADPNDVRPWGVKVHDGEIYIGVVCSGETSGLDADLDFYVMRQSGATFVTVLDGDLSYTKGETHSSMPAGTCDHWQAWTANFSDLSTFGSASGGIRACRPQPILSDIEFDDGGAMILGFMDRAGNQLGFQQRSTDPVDTNLYAGYVSGDILRAYLSGVYVLESGGTAPTGGCGANGQGPGGGEFYCGETYATIHEETSLGGLALLYGTGEVAVNVMDPFDVFSGGTSWMNNSTGADNRRYEVFPNTLGAGGTFGKSGSLGDIELICDAAPLEVGNRVWHDIDGDGIQDPGEPVLPGVTVQLFDMDNGGILVGTAVTDANGLYYFGGINDTNMSNGSLLQGTNYELRIDLADPALGGLDVTLTDQGADLHDNDSVASGGNAVITFGTGGAGDNNHTYDFGFLTPPTAVELSAFTARRTVDKSVAVEWVTESEIDNFGFRLYRSSSSSFDTAVEIHFEPSAVPGGSGPGTSYSYADTVPNYGVWYYWLEDVETGGATALHGPISVNVTQFYRFYLPVFVNK
jgi:hypothetical protein